MRREERERERERESEREGERKREREKRKELELGKIARQLFCPHSRSGSRHHVTSHRQRQKNLESVPSLGLGKTCEKEKEREGERERGREILDMSEPHFMIENYRINEEFQCYLNPFNLYTNRYPE